MFSLLARKCLNSHLLKLSTRASKKSSRRCYTGEKKRTSTLMAATLADTNSNAFLYAPLVAAFFLLSMETQTSFADDRGDFTVYRMSEVAKHKTKSKGIWVVYKDGVYDITKFISNHPGGTEKIMLAAGGDIAPFWNLYRQHFNSGLPMELLAAMRIGTLHPDDVAAMTAKAKASPSATRDPYSNDPLMSPVMSYYGRKPINCEAPGFLLTDAWITPTELWFVRNHHPVPKSEIDINEFRLKVGLDVGLKVNTDLSVTDLRQNYVEHSVVSSLQCGGNRRSEMSAWAKTNGSPWNISAISTAKWTGVRLRDILLDMGVDEDKVDTNLVAESNYREGRRQRDSKRMKHLRHVIFIGEDGMQASIPIEKALNRHGDVLIAYKMNDGPIPPEHGYPLRVVVPGHVGVRNVKWVKQIIVSSEEATGPWQRGMSYKGFGPSTLSLEHIDVEAIPSLQEQPVQSAITMPRPSTTITVSHTLPNRNRKPSTEGVGLVGANDNTGDEPKDLDVKAAEVPAGEPLTIKGYSYSGGGRGIIRVDVSIDGGKTWRTAQLTEGSQQPLNRAWAWTFWECDFDIPEDAVGQRLEIICKATDSSYNVQPDTVQGIWNLRGINNNSWHRVLAQVVPPEDDEEDIE